MKRILVVLLALILIVIAILFFTNSSEKTTYSLRPKLEQWCFDFADVLLPDVEREINDEGRRILKAFDVDFVVTIIPNLNGKDINAYAVDIFTKWKIGKKTKGKKGILILIAQKEKQVRIEIGYDLEAVYTDMYVDQVEREILKEFLEQGEWSIGFKATIENFLNKLYKKDIAKEIKAISNHKNDIKYYSQGAGATNVFDFGATLRKPLPEIPSKIKKYFSAQKTPELAFLRYMELSARAVKHNNNLTLFTDASNKFWKSWKHSSGQSKQEAQEVSERRYIIKQKNNRAVVFFPEDDAEKLKKSPMYFLHYTDIGWQVDIYIMSRVMRVVGPGWSMLTGLFHPYSEIIMKEYNIVWGLLTPWKDSKGKPRFFTLASSFYKEGESGFHIGVSAINKDKTNLKWGDRVFSVNGEKIKDWNHFWNLFDNADAGSSFKIKLIRNGKEMFINETLGKHDDGFRYYRPCLKTPRIWLGIYIIQASDKEWEITKEMRDEGLFRYSSLCSVLEVFPDSPADKAGLMPNDLIVDYGTEDDNGEIMPRDIIDNLYQLKHGKDIKLTIVRDLKEKIIIKITPEKTMHKGYF